MRAAITLAFLLSVIAVSGFGLNSSSPPPCDSYGDVTGDGYVNFDDLVAVQNLILSQQYDQRADVNGDGVVNFDDLTAILNYIKGYTDTFPVCGGVSPPTQPIASVQITNVVGYAGLGIAAVSGIVLALRRLGKL